MEELELESVKETSCLYLSVSFPPLIELSSFTLLYYSLIDPTLTVSAMAAATKNLSL